MIRHFIFFFFVVLPCGTEILYALGNQEHFLYESSTLLDYLETIQLSAKCLDINKPDDYSFSLSNQKHLLRS